MSVNWRAAGRRGAAASASSPKKKWPLRDVIDRNVGRLGDRDLLECGHQIATARDLFGPIYRYRRRCKECYERAAPKDYKAKLQKQKAELAAQTDK